MDEKRDWLNFQAAYGEAETALGVKTPSSVDTLSSIFRLLEDYDIAQVQRAIRAHLRDPERGNFLPRAADIIRQIVGADHERALDAWYKVLHACKRYGADDSVYFPEPAYIFAITKMAGSWVEFNRMIDETPETHLVTKFTHFKVFFLRGEKEASFLRLPDKQWVRPYLPGRHEIDNFDRGYINFTPRIVDVTTGKQVNRKELPSVFKDEDSKALSGKIGELAAKLRRSDYDA